MLSIRLRRGEGVLTPQIRKLALSAHVASSVGWLGAVAVFLALVLAALTNSAVATVRAVALAMQVTTWTVIVPLAGASLLTGLIVSLGTPWGLFRHYWVLVKFAVTLVVTLLLVMHTQPVADLVRETARTPFGPRVRGLEILLAGDAAGALIALLVNVALSVYKPVGVTVYGRRQIHGSQSVSEAPSERAGGRPRWVTVLAVIGILVLVAFRAVILHLSGISHHHMGFFH